jgi:signal transduction histidine kinase
MWLPNRIMQAATLLCLVATAIVLWSVLSQPYLGVTLVSDPTGVRIDAVDPAGPARALLSPARLTAVGTTAGAREIVLRSDDLVEEPDTFEAYEHIRAFMDRQSALAKLLHMPEVTLRVANGAEATTTTVAPSRRSIGDLPIAFWIQIVTGIGAVLIGACVLAMRPADLATRLFAVSGVMIMVSAFPAAIYSSRELAIDGGLFRVLSALNHVGALGFGMAMIALFLCYPRRLVPLAALWGVPAVFVPWLIVDILHLLPSQQVGSQLPTLVAMLTIVAVVIWQWFVNRNDARARAALNWLGLSVIVGAGAFVGLIITPILFDADLVMQQGHAFGFFLLIYAGLALGVGRYRLFDLSEWAFRVLFYTGGTFLLLAIDAALLLVLPLQHTVSFGIALLAVGFIYLPLRGQLWNRFVARRTLQEHELFRAVIDVSFGVSAPDRSERWRALLRALFDPLVIADASGAVEDVEIRNEGLEVLLPSVADTPALVLRHPWRGRRLFGTPHQQLARELVRMMRYIEESRSSYERGGVEERRRIARDLHDDVGARLLSGLYKTDVDDTHRVLRDAIADIRAIVSGLSVDRPSLGGMTAALRHETGERLAAAGIELRWPIEANDDSESPLDYQTYRCFTSAHREIVSNVIRHAKAKAVDIVIREEGGRLTMRIVDDGVGIDPAFAAGGARGNGLRGLDRRIRDLRGSLAVRRHGPGTAVEIAVPLQDAAAQPAAPGGGVSGRRIVENPHIQGVPGESGAS